MSPIKSQNLLVRQNQITEDFVEIELELAVTFCQIALTTNNSDTLERNVNNARRAYASARKYVNRMRSDRAGYASGIDKKIIQLSKLLKRLAGALGSRDAAGPDAKPRCFE